MEIKNLELTKDNKRNVKVCNAVRTQMFDKVMDILVNEGFEVVRAANGDIAIKTCVDAATGDVYFTRLAVSLSAKDINKKAERKAKAKAETAEVELPDLFADEDAE